MSKTVMRPRFGRRLLATGIGLVLTMFGLSLVFANVPAGQNMPFGLSFESVGLFSWSPRLELSPGLYTGLGAAFLLISWVLYFWSVRQVLKHRVSAPTWFWLAVVLSIIAVFVLPPVLSSDLYEYAAYGRMVTHYGTSPYAAAPATMGSDSILDYVAWPNETSRYGPAWIVVCALVSAASGDSIVLAALLFKLVGASSLLVCAWAAGQLAQHFFRAGRDVAFIAIAWNPLLLLEAAGSGHADFFMMVLALLGLLLYVRQGRVAGIALLVASVLTKYLTLVLCVMLWIGGYDWSRQKWERVRGWMLAAVVLGGVLVVGGLASGSFVLALPGRPGLSSCPSVPRALLDRSMALLLDGFGWQGASEATSINTWAFHGVFALVVLLRLIRYVTRGSSDTQAIREFGWLALVYIVIVYGGGYPWYMATPIVVGAVALVEKRPRLWLWSNAIGFAEMALYLSLIQV